MQLNNLKNNVNFEKQAMVMKSAEQVGQYLFMQNRK